MQKKGQIAIFIIIGALILAGAGLFFYLKSSSAEQFEAEETIMEEAFKGDAVKNYIETCLRKTAKDAIFDNSYYGGYFTLPEYSTTGLYYNVPYYIKLDENYIPSDEIFATEIAKYVDTMLFLCLDFKPFEKQGYVIEAEEPKSEIVLSSTKLIVSINMPTSITRGASEKEISTFGVEVSSVDFYKSIEIAREIANTQEGKEICLSCISDLSADMNVTVTVQPTYDQTYIYIIQDNNYLIGNDYYLLRFATQYEK